MYSEQMTQGLSIAAAPIPPASYNAGTQNTGGVDLSLFRRCLFILHVGSVGAAGTATLQLQESADNTTWANVATSGTWVTNAVTASNKEATIEIRAGQLSAGKRYVRGQVTIGTNAVLLSCLALGGEAEHKPGSVNNDASVIQQVTNP